ncbi:MAG TPA: hypothetical protein VFW83_03940, partial [Bryobacteraceae bacterium]|nr:hypothetical protein [Bryobacteraceae bacterium]
MKLLTLLAACTAIAIAEPVPVPKTSKIPATQDSHPFMAADHTLQPPDLAKHGYVEEEFLV